MAILATGQTRLERQLMLGRVYNSLTLRRESIEILNGRALGRCVDTRIAKRFLFHYGLDGQTAAGRQIFVCFDDNERVITTGTPVRADKSLGYSSSYRGWYQTTGDASEPIYFELGDEVKTLFIGVVQVGAGANPRVRSMALATLDPVTPASFPGYGDDDPAALPIVNVLPTVGSYELGYRAFAAAPAAGGRAGYVCVSAGTFGTLSGVTASTTSGSSDITVSTANALEPGQWISVAGAVTAARIERISGTLVTLSANATATVSNAATSFVAPSFAEWGDVVLNGSATYDPPSLATGASTTTTVTVTGAALGDFAEASFSQNLQTIVTHAVVTATNTVTVTFTNHGGSTLNIASGTLRVRVFKQ